MERLLFEYNADSYYHFWRHNYGTITWADFKDIENVEPTWHADAAADVWASCWELSSLDPTGRQHRMENALFWYDYFQAHPVEGFSFPWMVPVFTQKRKVLKNVRRC